MKNILLAALATISMGTTSLYAQEKNTRSTETKTIKVEGACGMCKKRIENAAYIPGVKRADWDRSAKELTIVYNSKKTSLNQVEKSVAAAGHDAGQEKASKENYEKLPDCCAYGEVGDH